MFILIKNIVCLKDFLKKNTLIFFKKLNLEFKCKINFIVFLYSDLKILFKNKSYIIF